MRQQPGDSGQDFCPIAFDERGRPVPAGTEGSRTDFRRPVAPRKPRILLVEDAPVARRLLARLLREEGYQVQAAAGGAEGLAAAFEFRPDLLLTDLGLPGMDGFALMRALRRQHFGRSLPVIVVTADPDPATREKAAALGVDRYFEKPADPARLLEAVRELTASARLRIPGSTSGARPSLRAAEGRLPGADVDNESGRAHEDSAVGRAPRGDR